LKLNRGQERVQRRAQDETKRILQNDDNLETTLAIGLGTFCLLDHGFYAGDSVARIVGRYGLPL
jgi:hypothetical protein